MITLYCARILKPSKTHDGHEEAQDQSPATYRQLKTMSPHPCAATATVYKTNF